MIKTKKRICLFFILYFIILFWVLVFKCNVFVEVVLNPRRLSLSERFFKYLIPFSDIIRTYQRGGNIAWDIFLCVMNVILLIPLGVFLPYLLKRTHSLIAVILMPTIIELFQLFTAIGVFASADLITNLLGGVIGLWIYKKLFSKIPEQTVEKTVKWLSIVMLPISAFAIIQTCCILPVYF